MLYHNTIYGSTFKAQTKYLRVPAPQFPDHLFFIAGRSPCFLQNDPSKGCFHKTLNITKCRREAEKFKGRQQRLLLSRIQLLPYIVHDLFCPFYPNLKVNNPALVIQQHGSRQNIGIISCPDSSG